MVRSVTITWIIPLLLINVRNGGITLYCALLARLLPLHHVP